MKRINVLVAEDEPLIRRSTIRKIEEIGGPFHVIGEAEDGREAVEKAADLFADLVITDIRMPELDGLAVAKQLKSTYPALQIIIITGYDDFTYAREALRCDVLDFLVKPIGKDDLRLALERAREQIEWEFGSQDARMRTGSGSKPSAESLVRLMTRYITDNCSSRDLNVAGLAESFGYSPDHITRLFREHLNTTPSDYILARKTREAVRLLREYQDVPIGEIAEKAGFSDAGHFSRVMKKQTGKTPTEIRNSEE